MALTIVATAGDPSANSYADRDQATSLVAYRVGASAWAGLTNDQQIQALVTATRDIDTLAPYFTGEKADDGQALEWPRNAAAILPPQLVAATIELAISYAPLFAADTDTDPLNVQTPAEQGIKREKVGPIETEYFGPTLSGAGIVFFGPGTTSNGASSPLSRFPAIVQRLLAPLVVFESAASTWGTGTAVRRS